MRLAVPLVRATFVRRLNRFSAAVRIDGPLFDVPGFQLTRRGTWFSFEA